MSLSKDSATSELALFIGMNLGFHTFFGSLKFYPLFFDDLSVAIVLSKFIEKPSIHCVGVCTHKLAVGQGDLFRFGIALAVSVIIDAFVEQLFG